MPLNLWDDPQHVIASLIPKYKGLDLGSADVPFRNLFLEGDIVQDDLTLSGDLTFTKAVGKIIPGATSIAFRNHADGANNLIITDAGVVTIRAGLTVTAGGETISAGDLALTAGDVLINGIGKSVQVKSGSNAKAGTVVVNGAVGTVVSTTAITANSVVCYGLKTAGGTIAGKPYESAVTPGTSFTVKGGASDSSTYNWIILDLI